MAALLLSNHASFAYATAGLGTAMSRHL